MKYLGAFKGKSILRYLGHVSVTFEYNMFMQYGKLEHYLCLKICLKYIWNNDKY